MLFPRTFLDAILMVEKSILFPLTFFDVILMMEKSTLSSRTFFRRNFYEQKFDVAFGKLQANENIRGGFPMLAILKVH